MPSEVEQNKYEKLFINSNIKVDNAIMFFHKTFDAMRLSGIGSAPKLIEMLNELIEGKACMNVSFEEIVKQREAALTSVADNTFDLVLKGAITAQPMKNRFLHSFEHLVARFPETKLAVETVRREVAQLHEDLYQTRINAEHFSNELHFARQLLAKHRIDCSGDHGQRIHYGIERLIAAKNESVEESQRKSFVVYWCNGTTSTVTGNTIAEALTLSGHGNGVQKAIDFWAEGETPDPKYEYYGDEWIEIHIDNI